MKQQDATCGNIEHNLNKLSGKLSSLTNIKSCLCRTGVRVYDESFVSRNTACYVSIINCAQVFIFPKVAFRKVKVASHRLGSITQESENQSQWWGETALFRVYLLSFIIESFSERKTFKRTSDEDSLLVPRGLTVESDFPRTEFRIKFRSICYLQLRWELKQLRH